MAIGTTAGRGFPALRPYATAGESEAQAAVVRDLYRLRMAFVERGSGAPLHGITVVITRGLNPGGLRFDDCGPTFFVHAEPGVYLVSATYAGATQSRLVDVRAFAQDLTFDWPVP